MLRATPSLSVLGVPVFLLLTSCRAPARSVAMDGAAKLTRGESAPTLEVFPRVIEEPQPISDAVLAQPETAACLAEARELRDAGFVVELSGAIGPTGKVSGARAVGVAPPSALCLERALRDLVLLPGKPGRFRLTLARAANGAGPGVIIEPGVGKKFE